MTADIHMIPSKYGLGHTENVLFVRDELLPKLIKNAYETLVIVGVENQAARVDRYVLMNTEKLANQILYANLMSAADHVLQVIREQEAAEDDEEHTA